MFNKLPATATQYAIQVALAKGLGVEDIAHQHGLKAERVRAEVDRLRAAGQLKEILGVK